MTVELSGLIPPLVTPLTREGGVDVDSLRSLIKFQLDAGASGIFVLGSSGEAVYLDHARCTISSGDAGMTALCAYLGPDLHRDLLETPDKTVLDLATLRFGAPGPHPNGQAGASPRFTEVRS